jgi:alanyl-tRNA synthetase
MKILDERFSSLRSEGASRLPAETAADLYTTYGFPLDLTEVIAAEQGLEVDADGAAAIIHGADDADGPIDPGAAVDPVYRQVADEVGATRFVGYERERGLGTIAALIRITGSADNPDRQSVPAAGSGEQVEIVVSETPFYAESGGQVGDVGLIRGAAESPDPVTARVTDTQRPYGSLTAHRAIIEEGTLQVGDEVALEVDHDARSATRRNHSATHLLHWALRTVLGEHAQQKGSRVAPDMLRFDFTQNQPLTREQIERIEDLVNAKILTNAPVVTDVLGIEEARRRGAVAIFEEKYGDTVRMLTMTEDSKELCGGTHTRSLGEIGLFCITSEGGTAAGVRRVFAVTGLNAVGFLRGLQHDMARASAAAKAQGGDLAEKITKLLAREKQLDKRAAELERQLLEAGSSGGAGLDAVLAGARTLGDVQVVAHRAPDDTKMASLRELAEKIRDKLGGAAVVAAGSAAEGKAQLAVVVTKAATDRLNASKLIRPIAARVGGSGGGRPDMAQAGGTDPAGLDEALEGIYAEVEGALGG